MPESIVVSDSTPLIHLARIGELEILRRIFRRVLIPVAVEKEIIEQGIDHADAESIRSAIGKWIDRGEPVSPEKVGAIARSARLHAGEIESIALALDVGAAALIMDEQLGVMYARSRGLRVFRTASVLLSAKKLGYIAHVGPKLDRLRESGFWLADRDYEAILRLAGE